MQIRLAAPADAADIAVFHVAGWRETYPGIVPDEVLGGLSVESRAAVWRRALEAGTAIWLAAGAGSVVLGRQRNGEMAEAWPDELHALCVLRVRQGRGLGRALLRRGLGAWRPFSAFVLAGNGAALGFYLRTGAVEFFRGHGDIAVVDVAPGWPDPRTV